MRERQKRARTFTCILGGMLLFLAIRPIFMGLLAGMVEQRSYEEMMDFVRSTGIVPFAAVMLALFAAFLPFPLLWDKESRLCKAYPYAAGTLVFVVAQRLLDEVIVAWLPAPALATSRVAPHPGTAAYNELLRIPWQIKAHYYLFALILVLFATNTLYKTGRILCGERSYKANSFPARTLVTRWLLLAVYSCICVFGAVVDFSDYGARMLTPATAIIATLCNLLAPVLVGLCLSGLAVFRYGREQLIPLAVAFLAALLVLKGRLLLLDGEFYHLGEGFFFRELLPGVSPADIVVVLLAPLLTYLIGRALRPKTML